MAVRSRGTKRGMRTPSTCLEMQLGHNVPTGPSAANSVIYIDKVLSQNNQRLYRQHKTYYADLRLSGQVNTEQALEVWVLKPNWYVLGALRMAKKHYDMAMKEERALLGNQVSRWSDFRISPNWTAGATQELSPLGLDKDSLNLSLINTTGAEYNYSQIRDRDGNDVNLVLAGNTSPAAGRISVFDEFDAAGNVSQSPVASTAAMPYEELYATGVNSDENADFLQTEGDLPPYRPTRHDEVWTKAGELISSIGGTQQLSTGVFAAPLGIVYLRGYQITTTGGVHDEGLTLEVLPGDYKGVMALDI